MVYRSADEEAKVSGGEAAAERDAPAPAGVSMPPGLFQRKIARRAIQRSIAPQASVGIELDQDAHTPDPSSKNASNSWIGNWNGVNGPDGKPVTQATGADVVGLASEGMVAPGRRTSKPTTVRVMLERFERLAPDFLGAGKVSVFGDPEKVTLVPGDRLEVYTWNTNDSGKEAIIGFRSSAAIHGLLSDIKADLQKGAEQKGDQGRHGVANGDRDYFGCALKDGSQGGFVLSGTVTGVGGAKQEVTFHQIARLAAELGKAGKDRSYEQNAVNEAVEADDMGKKQAVKPGQTPHYAGFNEQGQFYGDYTGASGLALGKAICIAAPGSTAYGQKNRGRDQSDPTSASAGNRMAAFWVPIHVTLKPGADVKKVKIFPYLAQPPGEGCVTVKVRTAGGKVLFDGNLLEIAKGEALQRRAQLTPGRFLREVSLANHPDEELIVDATFEGSSSTGLFLEGA